MAIVVYVLLLASFPIVQANGGITIDGNPNDWVALGLSPIGTDPPYNIKSYHDICADLLEAWVHCDSNNLYLMIKVRGGYPADWDTTTYMIGLDDKNSSTGDPNGYDYVVGGSQNVGVLLGWNETTLSWNTKGRLEMAAGDLGYVEWLVPFSYIHVMENVDFEFVSHDKYFGVVNTIRVNNVTIPEFPSFLFLFAFMTATLIAVVFTSGVNLRLLNPLKRRLYH
jgi:hypothetical protein